MIDVLRQVDLFDELSDACLGRLAACAREGEVPAGGYIVREGEPIERFTVLTEGLVEWVKRVGNDVIVVGSRGPVTYAGAGGLLTGDPAPASGRAVTDSRVLFIEGADFLRLLRDEPSVMKGALRLIAPVARTGEAILREREKLVALGTLSAGLAHELNNPAAAARRSASDLAAALEVLQDTVHGFVSAGIERSEAERLVALQREALARAAAAPDEAASDALAAAEREDALTDALDGRGLEGWRLAPALAEAGLDEAWLEAVAASAGAGLGPAVEWVVASLTARGLVRDLHESAERISSIVAAVKEYTYMDRAQLGEVDVHHGLETTLTILAHKLKQGHVRVERDYDPDLPHIVANGSQLNQVWTNLLDNALDAIDGDGLIRITTRRRDDQVTVEIADNGPGIPEEIRSRVFDPFFTTKDVGRGTGLGLDIVNRTVSNHRGQVQLRSGPEGTAFEVRLPRSPDGLPGTGV